MEFWGVEVKAGKPLKVAPEEGRLIHLSQASLGESKNKANESVILYVTVNGEKILLGTLSQQNIPQITFDIVFEKEVEVSHNWKNGSVYLLGYTTIIDNEEDSDMMSDEESSEEEDIPATAAENGKPKPAANANAVTMKAEPSANQGAKAVEPKKVEKTEEEDESEDDSESGDGEGSEDKGDADEMSEDDSSDEDDEETPKKVDSGKKRSKESAEATPIPNKKAKAAASRKTDGKKGGQTATPHPAKQTGKAPVKSPQSGGQFSCKSCSKSFNSEKALQSHAKAKHK